MNATDVLIDALRAVDGLRVGDGEPRDDDGPLEGRYAVVRQRPEQRGEGTIADPNADRNPEIQITAAGPSRRAADQVAEQARQVALGPLPTPAGWVWMQAAEYVTGTHTSTGGTVTEMGTEPTEPQAPQFFRTDVYRFYLTPA